MRYKIYIDYDGTGYKECFPDLVSVFKLTKEESTDSMEQFFYRINWGSVHFSNSPKEYLVASDSIHKLFDIINNLEFTTKVLIKHETELLTILGYFSRNDCDFDYDKKIIKVTPAVIDGVTDILENWENEVDFTNYEFEEIEIKVPIENSDQVTIMDWPTSEATATGTGLTWIRNRVKESDYDNEGLLTYFDGEKPKQTLFRDSYWGFMGTHNVWDNNENLPPNMIPNADYFLGDRVQILGQTPSNDPLNTDDTPNSTYGPNLDIHYGDYELSQFRVYEGTRIGGLSGNRWRQLYCQTWFTREETIKVDVVDDTNDWGFEPPVGDGWHLRKPTYKEGKKAHIWTRKPFNGAYSEAWHLQPEVLNSTESQYDFNWNKYRETKLQYDDTQSSFKLVTSIGIRDFMEYLIHNSDSSLATLGFKSTFFLNDSEGDVPYLKNTTNINYVTSKLNYLHGLSIFFTRDLLKDPQGKVKNIPKFTLKKMLDELNRVFVNTLIWFVDKDGYFRIEHKKYADLIGGYVDISEQDSLFFTSQWSFDKTMMFERFEFNQINAGYLDFTSNIVTFNKVVSNNRNKDLKFESTTEYISTDAKYCILNPDGLTDGIILMCLDSNHVVMNKIGDISGQMETNGYLALSNIILDFGTYEGTFNSGIVNGKPRNFVTLYRGKIGIELIVKGTLNSLFYLTQIGFGLIMNGEIDFENEHTKVKLRYRFNSSPKSSAFAIAFKQDTIANIDNFIIN